VTDPVVAIVVLPLVLAFAIACLRDPLRYALPVYAALIPSSSLLAIAPGPFGSVSSLLGLLLGIALLAQFLTTRESTPRLPLAVPIWLTFLALTGLSLFWSIAPGETVEGFVVLASLILLFVALAVSRFDPAALRRFEIGLVVGGVLIVGYGVLQLTVLGGLPAPDGRAARFGNDLLGANNQAAALLLPLAIAAARTLSGRRPSRVLHGLAVLLLVLGVVMTGSRGGLLATAVVLAAAVFYSTARRGAVLALGVAAVALLVVVVTVNPGGIAERQFRDTDSSGRTDIWTVGLSACSQYCLTGAGWGTFPTVYTLTQASAPDAKVLKRGTAYEPHNIFLLAVVEAGLAGLVLLILGLVTAVLTAHRLPRRMRGPPMAALLGTIVSSVFLSNLEFKFFWAVLAYVVASSTVAELRSQSSLGAATRSPVGGGVPA
jgi:O-antigen ligase